MFRAITIILSLVLALGACGGGSGGSPPPPPPPASAAAITTQPTDQSVVVGATAQFSVAATGATGFQWQASGDSGGTWSDINGATAVSYTTPPSVIGDNGKQFRAVASNSAGTANSNAATLAVTAAAAGKVWGTPALLEFADTPIGSIAVAGTADVLPSGQAQATVVWTQHDGVETSVYANRYANGAWQGVQLVEEKTATFSNSSRGATDVRVAMGRSGRTMMVWNYGDGNSSYTTWGNVFDPIPPRAAEPLTFSSTYARQLGFDNASGAKVAFDSSGHDAFVVWSQFDSVRLPASYHATQRQYLFVPCENVVGCAWIEGDNGWKSTTLIDITSGDAVNPQVAGYGSGQAVAIWQKPSAPIPLQFSTHTRAAGWDTPGLITPGSTVSLIQPALAAADDGSAIALWIGTVAGRQTLMASKRSGAAWSAPLALDDSSGSSADNPQVAMDSSGNAIVLWTQFNAGKVGLYTRRCPPGALSTCSAPKEIAGQFVTAENPSLAGARNGDAIVVWRHAATPGGERSIYAQHYSAAAAAWSATPALIDSNVFSVQVAMDNRGIATATWVKSEGGKANLYASRFE